MSINTLDKKLGAAWFVSSCLVVVTIANAYDVRPAAEAAANVFTNGRDLGIIAGVVVAFMLSVWLVVAGESRRRQKVAEIHATALDKVSQSLTDQSLSVATSIHNMIQHNLELSQAADRRLEEFMAFARGRPCFMADDARDLLREASRAKRIVQAAEVVAADKVLATAHRRETGT